MQWQVLDRAFSGHATMVLIGDPKQAIYAFRGGDVTTYLTAAATAATQQTLSVNWRSDAALLSAMQELLRGAALGDERIVVRDVEAHHTESRLVGAGNPFRVRVVRRQDVSRRPGLLAVAQVRPRIARDLAHDVRRLLDSGATFDGRPVRPRDIAVISYRHADLADAQAALLDVGVPGVIAGGGSVFATPAGGRLADAARGPRAAAPQHPRAVRRADLLLRPHRRSTSTRVATTSPTRSPRRCGRGSSCSAAVAWPP